MNLNTDYLRGNVILHIDTEKLANGMTKATSNGFEASAYDQADAISKLQVKLQDALMQNQLEIGM